MNAMQHAFSECFRTHAKVTALESGGRQWTYEALAQDSAQLAERLRSEHQVQPGDIIPIVLPRSPQLVMAHLAVLMAGAVVAPLDPALPPARLLAQLAQLPRVKLGWCTSGDVQRLSQGASHPWHPLDAMAVRTERQQPLHLAKGWAPEAGYILFTSGTSGTPKAVHLPLDGFAAVAQDHRVNRAQPGDRWALLASPGFDASIFEIWSGLLSGSTVVVQGERTPGLDHLAAFLRQEHISHALLTTSVFNALIEDDIDAFQSMRSVVFGGEAASLPHAQRLAHAVPGLTLINAYGPTECSVMALACELTPGELAQGSVTVGSPVGLARVAWDARGEGLVELRIGGGGLAHGYLGLPEETARRFTARDGERWYCTGDVFRMRPDGLPVFIERSDQQIKIQGVRIELQEIETQLREVSGGMQAVALAVGTQAHDRQVIAAITPSAGASTGLRIDTANILDALRERLPSAAVPRRLAVLPHWPMTLNGKVDRNALAHWLTRGAERPDFRARLQQVLRERADHTALVCGDQHWTYRQWDLASRSLAQRMRAMGVGPGDIVPLLMPRSAELLVAMLATLQVGAAYAPIDRRAPAERVSQILQTTRARTMLIVEQDAQDWPDALQVHAEPSTSDLAPDAACPEPWAGLHAEQALYVMFTSGSTGTPKGVVVPGDNMAALVVAQTWADFSPDARWLFCNSPAFDMSCLEIWGALLHGATLVILPGDLPGLDDMSETIQRQGVTHLQLPTATLGTLLDEHPAALDGVVQLITGGERASVPHLRAVLERPQPPRVINAYGPTETTVWSLSHTVTLDDVRLPHGIPIGRAMSGTHLRIARTDSPFDDCPPGEQGELWIAGTGVATGYLADESRTRERFVDWRGLRWYRTGDLVRARGDLHEYLGRADRQVKIRGQRLELDEIERLMETHPGVREACVLVLAPEDPERRSLVGVYSGHAAERPNDESLALFCATRLSAAAVPAAFVGLDKLPVNNNGKVDRKALEQAILPTLSMPTMPAALAPAATAEEKALVLAWQEVLGHDRLLGRHSHFLQQGGSSLLALKLSSALQRLSGRVIHPLEVLKHPVLADMAQRLSTPKASAGEDKAAQAPGDTWRLSEAQRSLLFAEALDPSGLAYLVHGALTLGFAKDPAVWQEGLNRLQRQHPMLQVCWSSVADGWQAQPLAPPVTLETHTHIVDAPCDLDWPPDVLDAIHRPLQANEGLMRAQIWPTRGGGQLFVWTLHHALTDEASLAELMCSLHEWVTEGREPSAPGEAFWMHRAEDLWMDRDGLQLAAARLAGVPARPSDLHLTVPALGQETSHALPSGLQRRVLARCREQGLEPFALFLQAFGLSLQRTLRIDMPIVSTPFSRRMRQDMFSQVDYCIDLRFIEAGVQPQESLREANRRIRESIWQAQQRQIQPVTALAEALNHLRPGASAALSQFHLTWRLDPTRDLRSALGLARVHRVPQITARHGLALHAAQIDGELVFSIEAVKEAQERGWVTRVWEGFIQALDELLAIDLALEQAATPATLAAGGRAAHEDQVGSLWAQWLGPRSDSRSDHPEDARTANWFREGGSSLSAMRMIASINKLLGTDLGLHQFLQNPTRAHLLGLLNQGHDTTTSLDNVHWVGPSDASQLKVLLPGYAGSAVGVFKLAQAIVTESADCAVLCVDLDAIVRATHNAEVFQRCQNTIVDVLKAHRADRQVELVGYSLGGLLALHALMSMPDHERDKVPVWLLDTYSPGRLQETLWYRAERFMARRWHRCMHRESATAPTQEAVEQYLDATEADEHAHAQWDTLARACNRPLRGLDQIDATLVRTLKTAREVGLIWRNRSNGWSPEAFRRFEVRHLDTDHLGITQRDAGVVAKILSAHGVGRTDTLSS